MSLDASAERDDIYRRYPPAGVRDIAFYLVLALTTVLVDRFLFSVEWTFLVAGFAGVIGWELTKFRLRRNADQFAASRSSH